MVKPWAHFARGASAVLVLFNSAGAPQALLLPFCSVGALPLCW